jgi:predicted short-subunit dehydrogenase-like oxidoreductase (DUF2520 family)
VRVLVAGAGAVGRALGAALEGAGVEVVRWRRGGAVAAGCDVAIAAVPDRAIGEVAGALAAGGFGGVILHCAGALPAEEAFAGVRGRVAGIGVLHPLRALAGGAEDARLAGTVFGVSGDAAGRAAAEALARRVGGRPLALDAAALARWHAAAVLAGNHTIGLVFQAVELLVGLGLPREEAEAALAGLFGSAAKNLVERGPAGALTGPIARGDAATVARHLQALDGEARALYVASARATLALARARGGDTAALEAIAALLGA